MGDQEKAVRKWVQILIESEIPKDNKGQNDGAAVQYYLSYFMKMLNGCFGSSSNASQNLRNSNGGNITSQQQTEERMIKSQLMRQAKTSSSQLKIQELLNKLDRYPAAIQNKNNILQLLYKLSNSAEIKQHFGNVEALFKNSKQGLQQNLNGTVMEIENNTTMHSLGTTNNQSQSNAFGQTQRSILSQSNVQFTQTLKRIHNKGNPNIDLTENDLIRDLLFTFQAIDAHYIQYNSTEDRYLLKSNVSLSDPVRELVNKLCVMGDLYRKIQQYLQIEPQGQIRQALHQAIRDELNEYYRLIAIFENELNSSYSNYQNGQNFSLSQASYNNQGNNELSQGVMNNQNQSSSISGTSNNQFTLRKLQLWVIEPQERLKWLAIICEATKGMSGFQVISAVNAYETQGSPPIQQLISRILQSIVQPFIKYVNSWVYNGELNDPLGEFFVTENIGETDIWNKRYSMVVKQIPNIIDKKNAITIFNIGRSINFLHKACKSTDWKLNVAPCQLQIVDKKSFDVFKQWIDQTSLLTNSRIVNILVDKYQLKYHLSNIKKYILMGQGDFIQSLMEILAEQLQKNANEIHRHNLIAQLDGVLKLNNNAFQDSSQRLDIKLLEASPGDKGWDIFTLDYNVDCPIDTILSPSVMRNYLKIFNFLWRVRRVSHSLSQVWIDHMKSSNLISKDRAHEPIAKLMKRFNILRHQMTHFINNLTCYIMVDAIETTWKQFLDDFDKTKDFSEIIETHTNFVQSVLDKSLLTEKNINIYRQMNSLFNLIIKFRNTQMVILTEIQEEYERIREVRNTNSQKRILNQFDSSHRQPQQNRRRNNNNSDFDQEYDDEDNNSQSDNQLESEDFQIPSTAKQFNQLQIDFQKQFSELLILLKKEDKLRFLSFKLDFNEYYNLRQVESITNFSQEQLNKYSASGTLRMNPNYKQTGLNDNNNNLSDPFNKQQQLPPNRETASFFKPDDLMSKQSQQQSGAFRPLDTKDSFFSNNSKNNNLKNSGFLNKDSSFLQNNSLFSQDANSKMTMNNMESNNKMNLNNFNKTNLSNMDNSSINSSSLNNFFQPKSLSSKNDFFKPNITSTNSNSNLPSQRQQYKQQFDNSANSNLDFSNNKGLYNNNKMEEESQSDNQSNYLGNNNIFSRNNQFSRDNLYNNNNIGSGLGGGNDIDSQSFKNRNINSNNNYINSNSKMMAPLPPQSNNFFKTSNTYKVPSRNNLQQEQDEDDMIQKDQFNKYNNYDSNKNRSQQQLQQQDDEEEDEHNNDHHNEDEEEQDYDHHQEEEDDENNNYGSNQYNNNNDDEDHDDHDQEQSFE